MLTVMILTLQDKGGFALFTDVLGSTAHVSNTSGISDDAQLLGMV
jgi:hypothetical protein